MDDKKKIFISYSQDSDVHSQRVLNLFRRLTQDGFECIIDQAVNQDDVREGLPTWMSRKVLVSDYVILICSERYHKIITGEIEAPTDEIGKWESVFSFNEIYNSHSLNKKFVPIIFNEYTRSFIPAAFKDRKTYLMDEQLSQLIEDLKAGIDFSIPKEIPVLAAPELIEADIYGSPQKSEQKQGPMVGMAELMQSSDLNAVRGKTIISGTILEVSNRDVTIDIGGKSEGVIPIEEIVDPESLNIGQSLEVYVEKPEGADGRPVVSYEKAKQIEAWKELSTTGKAGTVVSGRVKSATKGGLVVNVGIECFLPASQVDVGFVSNLERFVGQTLDFKILSIDLANRHVVVSRRELLEEQQQIKRTAFFNTRKVGDICRGTVRNILDFGAFVDLDGVDGLIPIGELSWARVSQPEDVVAVGESVNVKITAIDEARSRVGLSLKAASSNPWENAETRYPEGKQVEGTVVSLASYGAFIEVEPGIEALIHVSEFSWSKRIEKPEEMLQVGDSVAAVVMKVDTTEQKMSLSLRQMEMNPWKLVDQNYTAGQPARGVITRLANFGAFVQLEEGVEGLIHISDLTWKGRPKHPSSVVKVDQEVDVMVLSVDCEQKRIALGLKQISDDPWDVFEAQTKIGDILTGKVTRIADFGAFVEISKNIEGMVHISEISQERVNRIDDCLKIDQEVKVRVINLDRNERKIGLSIKSADEDSLEFEDVSKQLNSGSSGDLNSLGALFDIAIQKKK